MVDAAACCAAPGRAAAGTLARFSQAKRARNFLFLESDMADRTTELVVLMTHGADDELSSVGFTIANGGMTAGLRVSAFLTSAAVDLVRKRAVESTQAHPLEPLKALIDDFIHRGGTLWACTPCVKARGYEQADLIEGVVIAGSSVMHERIKAGAATLSF